MQRPDGFNYSTPVDADQRWNTNPHKTLELESDDAAGSDMDTHPTRSNHPPHYPPTHLQQINQQAEQTRCAECRHGRDINDPDLTCGYCQGTP
jgi:hypothetical protein